MRSLPALVACCLVPASLLAVAATAHADPPCGAVELRFQPGAWNLQIVAWVEDTKGAVVATPYITRATGQFGIGNRPGAALLKTDCGWPYGRREMVAPVWAHRRNHRYPKVVMGGACGNSIASVCGGGTCGGNCDDNTIAYHGLVSSSEPYFCAPEGCVGGKLPDVVSCASPVRTLSKGAYLDRNMQRAWSLYPPRADVTKINPSIDSPDVSDFALRNDLVAVSQATPRPGMPLDAPIYWNPENLPEGDYLAFVEVSQEGDFNDSHNHPNQDDGVIVWNGQGKPFLGQPSIVYRVPFHYDAHGSLSFADGYAGYGSWDGQDGTLHPPDGTITPGKADLGAACDKPCGEGRLIRMSSGHRVEVVVGACSAGGPDGGADDGGLPHTVCPAPPAPAALSAKADEAVTTLSVSWKVPPGASATTRYSARYAVGTDTPITADNFDQQLVIGMLGGGVAGEPLSLSLTNIQPNRDYQIAVRSIAGCGTESSLATLTINTGARKFTTLNGCFVATAAWGSPMEREVQKLRDFRDRALYGNAAGELLVATYYAFGPSLAQAIAPDERLRSIARRVLAPIAASLR